MNDSSKAVPRGELFAGKCILCLREIAMFRDPESQLHDRKVRSTRASTRTLVALLAVSGLAQLASWAAQAEQLRPQSAAAEILGPQAAAKTAATATATAPHGPHAPTERSFVVIPELTRDHTHTQMVVKCETKVISRLATTSPNPPSAPATSTMRCSCSCSDLAFMDMHLYLFLTYFRGNNTIIPSGDSP